MEVLDEVEDDEPEPDDDVELDDEVEDEESPEEELEPLSDLAAGTLAEEPERESVR